MTLRWRAADDDLAPFIRGFAERRDETPVGMSLELPLATPLLHLTLGADYGVQGPDGLEPMPRVSLWGASGEARLTRPAGRLHAFVAVLTFRGAAALAPDLAPAAAGRCLDLAPALGGDDRQAFAQARRLASFDDRVGLVQAAFRRLPRRDGRRPDGAAGIADAIASNRLAGRVADVAGRYGLSERTLRNRFRADIGCSPKQLLRVARFNRLVRAIHPQPWGRRYPGDIRLEYFDDAHLHNDFKALAGLSPRGFVAAKRASGDSLVHSHVLGDGGKAGMAFT